VTTIVETSLTQQGNRMNLIMKKVTSWAAIIAVPTLITGWYGQNLPYPGFAKQSGLIVSTVLIVGMVLGLYILFRRKDWLGRAGGRASLLRPQTSRVSAERSPQGGG